MNYRTRSHWNKYEFAREFKCIFYGDNPYDGKNLLIQHNDPYDWSKVFNLSEDPYWEDYHCQYPSRNRGFKAYKIRKKQLFSYQRRMYRTWKHNRKQQWQIY